MGDDADGAERAKEVGVEFRSLDEPALSDEIAEFKSVYVGRSKNRPRLTEFCCKRWIYIRNLMRAENLRSCLALDSDVLLFCDAAEEAKRFQGFAGTFTRWDAAPRYTPHCNFIGSLDGLEEFCDFLFEVYRNSARSLKSWNGSSRKFAGEKRRNAFGFAIWPYGAFGVCERTERSGF